MSNNNQFELARDILESVHSAEQDFQKFLARACDWSDEDDIAVYRSERRNKLRRAVLDRLVPDRKCHCGDIFPNSASWVINKAETAALCRACHHARKNPIVDTNINLFTEPKVSYRVDPLAIVRIRQLLGISPKSFAARMEWSRPYQSKLENGQVKTLSGEVVLKIYRLIEEMSNDKANMR